MARYIGGFFMKKVIRPISRITAIELTDLEIDSVAGGATAAGTDVYTKNNVKTQGDWTYDGSKPD